MAFPFKEYKNKGSAAKQPGLLCNREITKYFVVKDHQQFLDLIHSEEFKHFYELIKANIPVPPFFDVEVYKKGAPEHFENNGEKIIDHIVDTCSSHIDGYGTLYKKIITEAHNDLKKSYHIILLFKDADDNVVLFKDVSALKDFVKFAKFDSFKDSDNKHMIHPAVYREGLFRTIHSTKCNENRPFVKSATGDDFDDIQSFVSWHSTQHHSLLFDNFWDVSSDEPIVTEPLTEEDLTIVNVPGDLDDDDRKIIKKYVQKEYHHFPTTVRDVFVDKELNCIVVALDQKYCPFVERDHRSNHQYIIIGTTSTKQKCHDSDCSDKKHEERKLEDYPAELNQIIKTCLRVNKKELDLIDKAIDEGRKFIMENYDANVQAVSFDRENRIFRSNLQNDDLGRLGAHAQDAICNINSLLSGIA